MNSVNEHFLEYTPEVHSFFDSKTQTITYVVADTETNTCAIIDSVLDFEPTSCVVSYESADALISFIKKAGYTVSWILETHLHADHLTAAQYLKEKLGGKVAMSEQVVVVQKFFGDIFGEGEEFKRDGSQFDILFHDGDAFAVGAIPARAIHAPGHTPADMVYVIGDALFAGDTMFMPDYGSARCDFPGGNAAALYASAQKIFALPDEMRMFMCHDYLPEGRGIFMWETTVGEQRRRNIHLHEKVTEKEFITLRTERDRMLGIPKLIVPSVQINMRAGAISPHPVTGKIHCKVPTHDIFSA